MELTFENLKELALLGANIHVYLTGQSAYVPDPGQPTPTPTPVPVPPPTPEPEPEPVETIKYARVKVIRKPSASPFQLTGEDGQGKPIITHPPVADRPLVPYGNRLVVNLEYQASEWDKETGVEGGIWSASLGKNNPVYFISTGSGTVAGHPGDFNLSGWFIRCDQVEVIGTFEQ